MKELSLVVFTLATQTAVGMLIWLGLLSTSGDIQTASYRTILAWALGLSVSALLVSFLHLGSPLKAIHVLRNLRKSWLSREVGLAGGFTLWLGIAFYTTLLASPTWQVGSVWLAAFLGICLVYAMANVYRLRTAPNWSGPLTGPGFFLTGILLGGSTLAIKTISPQAPLTANTSFRLVLLLCLFLQITLNSLDHFYRVRRDPGIQPIKSTLIDLRIAGLLASGFALVYWSVLAGAGLILLSEFVGRIEFYNRRSRLGL